MERGKTIQQAMRKVFREVREEYRTKEQNTIAHPLVDKCVEVGKTNHFNSTINSLSHCLLDGFTSFHILAPSVALSGYASPFPILDNVISMNVSVAFLSAEQLMQKWPNCVATDVAVFTIRSVFIGVWVLP